MNSEHFDVVVVGAGLSGIGAAWHLQTMSPSRSYVILEARDTIGGTWDLFRYPGIRSDSDMYTLGYSFKPWTESKAIADGSTILDYVRETAREHDLERHIRFNHRVTSAAWSSAEQRWTVETSHGDETRVFTCNFIHMCSGYYSYAEGHSPDFAGAGEFAGRIVHPQFWPDDLDYAGKNVVVIGSGATAVTLVPEMARDAAHVTMLQRSPTYVVSRPAEDPVANWLRAKLPPRLAYRVTRWKNVGFGMFFYRMARKKPAETKQRLLGFVREHMGPDYDVDRHFTPSYNPWDQRLCLVPNADLFLALKSGKATVVTDHIDRFVPDGIQLTSGETLPADVIVTATGLKMQMMGGATISVDGALVDTTKAMIYRGMMLSGVPNMAFCFGYTNASWTLKADLVAGYICRLLNYMERRGIASATPTLDDPDVQEESFVDFNSGYIQRAQDVLPRQGSKKPWKLNQNYALDMAALKLGKVDDGTLRFVRKGASATGRKTLEPA